MASADVLTPSPGGGGAIDITRLSTFLLVGEDVISSLAGITEDYITSVLRAIDDKAREYEDLRADKLRIEVELEQSVRTTDNKVKGTKKQLDASLAETQELKSKLDNSETARKAVENELQNYKSSRVTVDEEVHTLRTRVQSLESDKRDTLEALDRKANDYDRLQDEYAALQSKSIETRREVSSLETQLRQAQSMRTSSKFKEQNLLQEVELLKKNNAWLDNELSTKVAEFQKFRKEKAAQVSALQRELDEALSSVDITQRNSDNLKQRFDEVSKKAQDALAKVQDLQNKAVLQEENFRNEMHSQQRLAELFEQSTKSARARVADLERLLEQERERESVEIGRARAAVETERAEKDAAITRVSQLEVQVERLEADLSAYASGLFSAGSPRGSINGNSTPNRRPGSAAGTPGGLHIASPAAMRLQKSGISVTQLYSDYMAMKASYEAEKRRNTKLEEAIEEVMQDLEQKAPEIQELREEDARLQKDLIEMSELLDKAHKENEQIEKDARTVSLKFKDAEREVVVLRKQLRDLSSQVQVLLVEIEHRDSGADPLSASQNEVYEQIISGAERDVAETDTDRIISQKLTIFRGVRELQDKNEQLLKAIRELTMKMEQEDQERRNEQSGKEGTEVAQLRGVVAKLKDELTALGAKAQSFVRERDMFRRMLQNKGDLPPNSNINDQDMSASEAGATSNQEGPENLAELLRELQTQYDQFKTEALENHTTLNDQARRLAQEKTELEVKARTVASQLELANDRYEMLNGNFNVLRMENTELQKRIASLQEAQAKDDAINRKLTEDLADSQSVLEGMRNETANLKAEKNLWRNIEQRLAQDNEALGQERTRLNELIADLQSMQAQREREESETRRRLNSQNEKLETEIQQTKRRLSEEIEAAKKFAVRKEIDARDAQKKIDDINSTLASTRESLVASQTNQTHLRSRVEDLTSQLKSLEERLATQSSQPQVAPRAEGDDDEDSEYRQRVLQEECDKLQGQLNDATNEINNLKTQVDQYKLIALTGEEELASINETYDAYKESMEKQASEQEDKIRDLKQRLEDTNNELASVNQELSDLQQAELEKRQQFEDERILLQTQINSLKEDAEKNIAAVSCYKEDTRSQARIAEEAQQNYERELVKHAEAAQALQQVREEHSKLKGEVYQIKSEAETAKANLAASESSWESQKEMYVKELEETKKHSEGLSRQYKILLDQFENVNTQISEIKKSRATLDDYNESREQPTADRSLEDLREVLRYLRNEKEIVDVQYDLCLQENRRLKQQLDYTKTALDENKLLLAQERERESAQLRGAMQHKDLMERISELNILRESNSALRSDCEKKAKKANELTEKVNELLATIRPLQDQVSALQAEKEAKEEQVKLLQQDGEHWKARAQQILQKYDRVDPAELEALKEQARNLEEKCNTLEAERDTLQKQVAEFEELKQKELTEAADVWRSKLSTIVQTTKTKLREANEKFMAEKKNATDAQEQLEALRTELNTARQSSSEEVKKLQEEKNRLESEFQALQAKATEVEENFKNYKGRASTLVRDMNALKKQYEEAQAEINTLRALGQPAPVAPMAPVTDEATIEAEVARRIAALPPVDNSALIEAEVARRLAEIHANQPVQSAMQPIDHTAAIETEVARRIADYQASQTTQNTEPPQPVDNSAAIEAEVAKRISQAQIIANSAAVEAEVSRRLAESQASHGSEPGEVTPSAADVEKIVEDRVKKEKEKLEQRITEARKGFQEYKAKAVAKALSDAGIDFDKKMAAKDEEHKKQVQALEESIVQLKSEIEELKKQLEQVKETQPTIPQVDVEQHQKALEAKDLEYQKEIQKIKEEEESRLEQAKVDIRHEVQAEFLVNKGGGETDTTDPSAKKPPTQEELKAVIKRNVEHRLGKEKEKWQREIDNEQEKIIESKLQGVLEETLKEKEAELQAQQAALLEKSKDALRQEGAARIKVQLSMMEKRNKTLEEKVKAYESLGGGPPQQAAPPATGIKPPGVAINPAPQQGETSQIPLPRGQGPPRRADGQGTGPAVLRSLRGALESSIPRGGGRGGGQGGRGAGGPPQQQQQQQPQPGMQQSPGASQPYLQSAFQNPQMGQMGQMGQMSPNQQQQHQQGLPQPVFGHRTSLPSQGQQPQPQPQLPRPGIFSGGRGAGGPFNPGQGRGRGGAPQLQNIQTGHPQQNTAPSQQSPGRGMNPVARQFVPTKRLREDGTEMEDQNSNIGKRIRGGHTG